MVFYYLNAASAGQAPAQLPSPFHLKTPPGTDIWKKPPNHNVFDAPICYMTLPKLSAFRSARVRVSGEWKTLFDQGGLCLILPSVPSTNGPVRKWVKTGIELFNHRPHASAVACDQWADWSLWPMQGSGHSVTIEMEREIKDGTPTATMWIYIVEGDARLPIREISWVFSPEHEDLEAWVGVYAAKPKEDAGNSKGELEARFDNFELVTV